MFDDDGREVRVNERWYGMAIECSLIYKCHFLMNMSFCRYVEDISDFLLFCMQYGTVDWIEYDMDNSIVTWLLTTVCAPQCIKNPYVLAKLVEVLFVTPQNQNLHNMVMFHPIAQSVLVSSLMKFYVDIETTGNVSRLFLEKFPPFDTFLDNRAFVLFSPQSTEFYDKFTIRYHISHLFKNMWENAVQRQGMIDESKNGAQFVKFVNMLMNDTTFLLDECLEYLKRINEVEMLTLQTPAEWSKLTPEQQQARRRQLAQDERQCRSYLTLAMSTVDMFHYLTVDIKEPFLRPELVDRLSSMLNYNLNQLCGPKYNNLKVREPKKYGWEPRRLLGQIFDIYLHLDSEKFAGALAADERSFEKDLFEYAAVKVERMMIRSAAEVEKFRALLTRAHDIYGEEGRGEEGG